MNKYIGDIVTINKPTAHTHGRCGEIKLWNDNYEKFEVHFDEGWGGFYTLKELTFENKLELIAPHTGAANCNTKAPDKKPNPCGCGEELGDNLWGFCSPECLATHYKENE